MGKSHYAPSKINPVHKETTTFAESKKHGQEVQVRFNEKHGSSRS